MTARHYDVVVLGRSLGALTTAALLARREFRVLLLGQASLAASYRVERHRLMRRSFTFLCAQSPVWRKVLRDLAQSQSFSRRLQALDPMFSFLSPGRRLELSPDVTAFSKEIDREFPKVRQLIDEFHSRLAVLNSAIDATFEREISWPPGTLLERWEAGRAIASIPLSVGETTEQLLGKFPPAHSFRDVALLPSLFASDLDEGTNRTSLSLARLHGSWVRGLFSLPDGPDELEKFLLDRITAHGGECRLSSSASQLVVQRGRITGILEEGAEEEIGASAVVSAESGEAIAALAGGEGVSTRALQRWPRLVPSSGRCVCSVVLRSQGLPELLGQETFLLPASGKVDDPNNPCLHVQRFANANDETLLVAELLIPLQGALRLRDARQIVLSTLRFHFPFLDEHLLLVDSTHDGLPVHDYSQGKRVDLERAQFPECTSKAEPMERRWSIEPPGFLDVAGEPLRGPIAGSYLVGKTVLPGLGQEGELLAAWSVARILTKKDSVRQRRRRQMWTKIETG
ncbi:MAG TPA: phytoene dehydrogenase [Polyangiaceae bacterium]|nr:phytoene dehydrogenase [Polyangiaceae bacterium]